ncbi:hypothetical protein GTC6_08684 [Gordonia terrae C-6]|uniref:Methionine/alanine importer small subunit n=1 Tax=Gordonia terrae C-6 TaxID=1316928 RepID=R7YAR3_9ACTN|nr:methionine/alanine import family NSS transporter small subunit [Gordonia terrae]EON33082.1 hypothetical protein GTC6_08684 [Gordonia terrae C-6]
MSGIAIVMLIVSITIVWGGLVASIVFLRRRPEVEGLAEDPEILREDTDRASRPHPSRDT